MVWLEDASRNDGSNGIGGIVKAIDKIERQRDEYNEDYKD
jgi:hypothetical protein